MCLQSEYTKRFCFSKRALPTDLSRAGCILVNHPVSLPQYGSNRQMRNKQKLHRYYFSKRYIIKWKLHNKTNLRLKKLESF